MLDNSACISCETCLSDAIIVSESSSIGPGSFEGCKHLKSVVIPKGILTIEKEAFKSTNIESVIIPDSVTVIEDEAFNLCEKLKEVKIGSRVTKIGKEAFSNCKSLVSIVIPDSVISLGERVFYKCKSLKTAVIGSSVWAVKNFAFHESGLVDVSIGSAVTRIGISAFARTHLKTVVIPDSVNLIDDFAFLHCEQLKSVDIGKSVTKIGDEAFFQTDLEHLIIPDSVTSIGDATFTNNFNMKSIKLGDSVAYIGPTAFYQSAPEIVVPVSVMHIGKFAFARMKNVTIQAWYGCDMEHPVKIGGAMTFTGCISVGSTIVANAFKHEEIYHLEIVCEDASPCYDGDGNLVLQGSGEL